MESEAKDEVRQQIEDLMRKIERHEWRILDLEKRLISKEVLEAGAPLVDEATYKEPILQKASAQLLPRKKNNNYNAWFIGLSIVCIVIGTLIMKLI